VTPATAGPTTACVEDRGTLTIGHTVVRKIAERAADRVPGTARARRRIGGLALGGEQGVSATISGWDNDVDLALDVALHYPAPVRDVVGEVRAAVTGEIERLTAYHVRSVRVTVSALVPETSSRVR
jgi:uncharacterized alkaline shock family protein YloU